MDNESLINQTYLKKLSLIICLLLCLSHWSERNMVHGDLTLNNLVKSFSLYLPKILENYSLFSQYNMVKLSLTFKMNEIIASWHEKNDK